jgi:hypothetical protein
VGAFKAGAAPGKAAEGVNSRDRYRAAQSLGPEKGFENRRNPELNNLVFKKNTSGREERDLPPLPPLSASRTGSSAGGGGGARERPKPSTIPPPLETETMLINLGGATRATLPLQSQSHQPQQVPSFTQNGNQFNGQSQFIPQTQFQMSPQPQTQSLHQQYTNNPFMQSQSQPPQYSQQQFLSPSASASPSPYGPYGNGAMGTSPGGTNPFLQMNQGQQQMGQGQMYGQGQVQGQGWNGQGHQMQNGWQGQGQQQPQQLFQQPQQQYGQQQQQGWPNMGMAGMGMGYAQGH